MACRTQLVFNRPSTSQPDCAGLASDTIPAIGTIGMPIPVPENKPTLQNPNKTEPSVEKPIETIPQKNAHPIPVAEEKERRFSTGKSLPHQARSSNIHRVLPHNCPFARYNLALPYQRPVPDLLGARPSRPQHSNLAESAEINKTSATDETTPTLNEPTRTTPPEPPTSRRVMECGRLWPLWIATKTQSKPNSNSIHDAQCRSRP